MPDATLATDGVRPAVRLERRLSDPPSVVWRAISQPDKLRAWFPCEVMVEGGHWRVGASLTFVFPPEIIGMTLTGEVLEVEEPHRLVFTWGEDTLTFTLTPEGDGTLLVLIDELPAATAARNAAGWDDCLDRLGGHTPGPGNWGSHFAGYSDAFEPALGPQQGPPSGYKPAIG